MIDIGHPKFLSEQSGPFEEQLKERLCLLFDRIGNITRAYLLGMIYEGGFDQGVVLGLRADRNKMAPIVTQVGEAFASLFSKDECLDIALRAD
jgi:hypothetical protein